MAFLAPIQIRRSICKSASVYMATRASLGAEVDLGVRIGSGKPGIDTGEPAIVVLNALTSFLPFVVTLLRVESLFGSLGIAKFC